MPTPRPISRLAAAIALTACSGGGGSTDSGSATTTADTSTASSTGTTTSDGTTGTSAGTTTGGDAGLTYYRDIKAIVDARCAGCHRPGDIAPFSLTTYAEVAAMAPYMVEDLESRTMPPWPPAAACRTYEHDRSLGDGELAALLAWIDLGAPEGDPKDAPPAPDPLPPLGFDVDLAAAEPYTPTVVPDEYRCFLYDWPKDQVTYATGFTIEPGDRAIVHHVIAFIIPPSAAATYEALDAADPAPGYPCFGSPGGDNSFDVEWLGAWVPGIGDQGAFPEGTGIEIRPGSKIAVQLHYHPFDGSGSDLSHVKVRTAPAVDHPAYLLPLANPAWIYGFQPMTIPAGAADVVHAFDMDVGNIISFIRPDSTFGIGEPVVAHAASAHMHTLGKSATLSIVRGGGGDTECLLDIPRWDFNWQGLYPFTATTVIDPADKVRIECHFDNSKGQETVAWGEGTGDEMCLGLFYVSKP